VQLQPDEPLELARTQAASLCIDVNGSRGMPAKNTRHREKNDTECLPPYLDASGHSVSIPRAIRRCPNGAVLAGRSCCWYRSLALTYVQHSCPNCGAPIDPTGVRAGGVRCGFCAVSLTASAGTWHPTAPLSYDEELRDPERERFWFDGCRYAILGRLARGEGSDVFLARRDGRLSDLVVVKALRSQGDIDLLVREHEVLAELEKSKVQGSSHFSRLIPQRVGQGTARLGMRGKGGDQKVAIHRWRSGFVHTFDDVAQAHPGGIDPAASVWIWKRTLEVLGWMHRSGWIHGAVLPPHILVHARDHGVALVGLSRAVPSGRPLPAFSSTLRAYYPDAIWNGGPATEAADIAMSARAVLHVLGRNPLRAPPSVAAPLAQLLEQVADGQGPDAWHVRDQVDAVAQQVFGPPKFIPFEMPGWA
jgi:hypothetical protein